MSKTREYTKQLWRMYPEHIDRLRQLADRAGLPMVVLAREAIGKGLEWAEHVYVPAIEKARASTCHGS